VRASDETVSVIIPTYNGSEFIAEAIESVLRQTRPPEEVVVVNDGSTDDTAQVIMRFGKRVRYLEQPNRGVAAARNTGLAEARGRYVALLDHDDVCEEDRLRRQCEALQRSPEASACFTGLWTFDEHSRLREFPGNPSAASLGPIEHLSEYHVFGPTVMFDRVKAGGDRFPEDAQPIDDHAFVALLRTRGEFVILPELLYGHRDWPGQTSRGTEDCRAGGFWLRLRWALAHHERHWPGVSAAEVERIMWHGMANQVASNYWARNRDYFLLDREFLRTNWPAHLPRPPEWNLRWIPDWLWWCRTLAGSALRRCTGRTKPV
jgi:glycosyltransferase involved in cell wall biosynthesis